MADGQTIFQGLLDRGFNPAQAAALAGNIQQESSFDPSSTNEASGAYGLLNWRLDRRNNLLKYAADTGRSATDPNAQLDFIVSEMQGPEAKNAAPFLSAQDVDSANAALAKYVRYGKNEAGNRLKYAQAFAGQQPQSGGAVSGFVNPSFNGGMPGVPSLGAAPQQPTQPGAPAAVQPSTSDDDLLKAFLAPGEATTAAGAGAGNSSDDDLLAPFLKGATEQKSADPLAGTQQLFPGADALSAAFTSGVEALPIIGPSAMNALTNLKSGVQNMLSGHSQSPEQIAAIDKAVQAQQPVASGVGTVAGTVGPYLAGGAIPGVARGLGMTGNLLTRIALGGASSAGIEGADTLARGGTLADAGRNALLAGGIGAAAAPVADLVGAGVNKLLSGTSPEVAQLAQVARDKYGIPIGPGQMSDNQMVRFADSVVNKMPLSGGTVSNAAQQTAFNRAVSNTFGQAADRITPDVMAAAKARIGNDFDTVAQKVTSIPYDQPLENALSRVEGDAGSVLQASQLAPLKNQLDQIVGRFAKGNGITGETYQALTSKGAPLDRLMNDADPNVAYYAGQIRDALDDALQRNAPQDVQQLLSQARSQYKAMKTIEPLVEKAPTGDISPALLMGRVNSNYGNVAYGGGGDLAELARIGQRFLKGPPSSGTAERLAIMDLAKKAVGPAGIGGAAIGAALNPGAIPMAVATGIPALAGYALAAKGAGALLRSKNVANKLIENSLKTAGPARGGVVNQLTRSAVPLMAPQQPLQITVHGGNPLLAQ